MSDHPCPDCGADDPEVCKTQGHVVPDGYVPEPCPCGQGHNKMKGSSTCRVCGRWMEGGYREDRDKALREMDQGHCETCVPNGSTNVPKILTNRPHHVFTAVQRGERLSPDGTRTLAEYALALEQEVRNRATMSGYDLEECFLQDVPVEVLFTGSGTPNWVALDVPVTEDVWPMQRLRAGHRGLAFVARRKLP